MATQTSTTPAITSYLPAAGGGLRTQLSSDEIVALIKSGESRLWVDVDSRGGADWLELADDLNLHPLTIEDTFSRNSRVKVEEYDGYLFIVVRDVQFAANTPDPYDFETSNLYLILGKSYLITVHARPSRATATLGDRLREGPELFERGVDYLTYLVLDALTDLYFPLLDQIDTFVDNLEVSIFQKNAESLEEIFALKRTLLALRRHQAPVREIMATLANRPSSYIAPGTQVYVRDVYDHVVRQVESIETYRDLLTGALEVYFSVVSNRMNEVIKALSIIATLILPATWVASIYGMNFRWMPFLHSPYGFWIAFGLMGGVSALLLVYLKRRGWF